MLIVFLQSLQISDSLPQNMSPLSVAQLHVDHSKSSSESTMLKFANVKPTVGRQYQIHSCSFIHQIIYYYVITMQLCYIYLRDIDTFGGYILQSLSILPGNVI